MVSSSSVSFCGGLATTRRGFLAAIWSIVNLLTVVAFTVALTFCMSSNIDNSEDYYYYNQGNSGDNDENDIDPELAVTSRAMAFAAMWTAVLAVLLSIFGTVILGWQSPTGQYYTCCTSQVHKTTPITLGGFIGALLMFSNLALVCAAFFGEFEVRDYRQNANRDGEGDQKQEYEFFTVRRKGTSTAFSILCLFLAVMYGSFAGLVFYYSNNILEELIADETEISPESKQVGLAPLASPRLSSKGAHFVRPHEVAYPKHTLSSASPGGFVTQSGPGIAGSQTASGTMA